MLDLKMRTFVATFAIMACVGILLPFHSVDGGVIRLIAKDGSYIPGNMHLFITRKQFFLSFIRFSFFTGSILNWGSIYKSLQKVSDEEGKGYLRQIQAQLDPLDDALTAGDLAAAAKILRENALPLMKQAAPHYKMKMFRSFGKIQANLIEMVLLPKLEQENATINDFNEFLITSTNAAKAIFQQLFEKIIEMFDKIVDNMADEIDE